MSTFSSKMSQFSPKHVQIMCPKPKNEYMSHHQLDIHKTRHNLLCMRAKAAFFNPTGIWVAQRPICEFDWS